MTTVRRQVREQELELLRLLAGHDPEFRDDYLVQISALQEVEDWDDGSSSITIAPARTPGHGIRVQAIAEDEDGVDINVILFGRDRSLCILELVRLDGAPLKRYPSKAVIKDVWDFKGNPPPVGG